MTKHDEYSGERREMTRVEIHDAVADQVRFDSLDDEADRLRKKLTEVTRVDRVREWRRARIGSWTF